MAYIEDFFQTDILNSVFQTSNWLESISHTTRDGLYWDVLPGTDNDPDGVLTSSTSLYGGGAGIALFYLRLYEVTGNSTYLDYAKGGVDYIIANDKGPAAYDNTGEGTLKGIPAGYLNGPSGGAYVSYLLYETSHIEKYKDYAIAAANTIIEAADDNAQGGITWSGAYGIISDGGLILFLIWMYEKTGNISYLKTAREAGLYIVSQADETDSGLRFAAMDTVAFGLGENGFFPGFFYGTAGTGYILAKLYEHTREAIFLEDAKKSAGYLISVADLSKDHKKALLPYNVPYKPNLHYLGVCQGPVGSSRLFYELYKVTGEQLYYDWVIRLTDGILQTGAPKIHSDGYWHTYCYCCGAAGMIEHFIAINNITGNDKYLNAAKDAVESLLGDSVVDDGKRCWYTAWNRHLPKEVLPYSGLYIGSAGDASSILTYYNYTHNKNKLSGYLEDPYTF